MKVYCKYCKYSFTNNINPSALCCCPEYAIPQHDDGNYYREPEDWYASVPCEEFNTNNDCKFFIKRSLFKRFLDIIPRGVAL